MSKQRGSIRGRGGRGRGVLRPSPSGPNLSDRVPPAPASSLNVYPDLEMSRRASPPSRSKTLGDAATQPSTSMGFHEAQQQQQGKRQNSATDQETLAEGSSPPRYNVSLGPPSRNYSSPPESSFSNSSQSKRSAPYDLHSDNSSLSEPGPSDSVSQRCAMITDYRRTPPRSRTGEMGRDYAPAVGPIRKNTLAPSFQPYAFDSNMRQRMPSVMGNASDFLGGFDPDARFNSSMSVISDREATSEAWVNRQRIKPGRAKTKKVRLTKGRFIAEYGKSFFSSFQISFHSAITDCRVIHHTQSDVPSAVRNAMSGGGYGHMAEETEFTHMRYTAA